MTKVFALTFLVALSATITFAQEPPTPAPSQIETSSPSPSLSPTATASVTARNVPLRFVPPPMGGTISLGIWDTNDKLVRVLHREAKIDSFTVEENSLSTAWDGKNDAGEDLPSGKYRARGYLVGKLKIDDLGKVASPPKSATDHISVKLVMNPLVADTRSVMEVSVGFDSKGSFLKTTDGLPLATINENSNVSRVVMEKNGEKAADVWQEDASGVEHLQAASIDKMMAFDCGFFQLK
ncbi:MAG TPA: hypothetical protein VLK27_11795 [Chthoniobacterales bacterium]|nr:hypothetical protein [Chthoniobacterales bacterium]